MKLHQLIAQYVAFRKSLGAKFECNETVLRIFSSAIGKCRNLPNVKPRDVAAFLNGEAP